MNQQINNLKILEPRRRVLRNKMPKAEIILWSKLKGKQLKGIKFRRQHSIGKYILDFYCPEYRIAIELDGQSHENSELHDHARQKFIENFNIKVLRFNNFDVYRNLNLILEAILGAIPPRPTATPP